MKNLLLGICIISFLSTSYGQDKYLIYFKDKGVEPEVTLNKSSVLYKEAHDHLTERAIERRKKTMGDDFITYEDLPVKEDYINQLQSRGIEIVHKLTWFNAVSAYLNKDQLIEVKSLPYIKKVDKVKIFKSKREENSGSILEKGSSTNTGLDYGNSFVQLDLIDVPIVHTAGITGEGVILGLLDTGFDWQDHESLVNVDVIDEYDFVYNDPVTANQPGDPSSQHNHGTSVMSEVAGFMNGTLIGASFGSSFLLAKTEDLRWEAHIEEDNYAAALIWMENLGVDVTSSSLGYSEFDDTTYSYTYPDMDGQTTIVTQACELAFSRGVVTITSAGNEGNGSWFYITAPADGFNTIAVGAVTSSNIVASFSSHGPTFDGRIKPDILTQGVNVYAASASGFTSYTSSFGGTSAAAPLACGIAGLLLSAHPHLTNVQVRDILIKTADTFNNPDNSRGYGLASAQKSINYPNIESVNESFKMHKIFINDITIDPATVKLNYAVDGGAFQEVDMAFDGILRYDYLFTDVSGNQSIEFYFTYSDVGGGNFREPATGNYGQVALDVDLTGNRPIDFVLNQNYPNPFNPATTIKYQIPEDGFVTLKVYDILGNEISTLIDKQMSKGSYSVVFNSSELVSGVYIYRLQVNDFTTAKKMMLLR